MISKQRKGIGKENSLLSTQQVIRLKTYVKYAVKLFREYSKTGISFIMINIVLFYFCKY